MQCPLFRGILQTPRNHLGEAAGSVMAIYLVSLTEALAFASSIAVQEGEAGGH